MKPENLDHEKFRRELLTWWAEAKREYPWRATHDPYRILVAETLLHRTRADQVVALYHRFLDRFPDIHSLAAAEPQELHDLLFSAGLRWRVDLLLKTAQEIERRFQGEIPHDRKELESLPGVGPYIAAAIRCFAFGEADAILDTNTVRIASRVFGFLMNDSSRRSPRVLRLLESLLDRDHPAAFNLALLDLGALVCLPRAPLCDQCPVQSMCTVGRQRG